MINKNNILNFLCLIPARGGSKGIPKKNLIKLGNTPLIQHTLDAALNCKEYNLDVYVSTEDKDISDYCKQKKVSVIQRPNHLASDTISIMPTIEHAIKELKERTE